MGFVQSTLNDVIERGKGIPGLEFPDVDIVVFFEIKVPISVTIHLLEKPWSNTSDDFPFILGGSSKAALRTVDPAFVLWRFDEDFTGLCITNENKKLMGFHGEVLDQSPADLVAFNVGTHDISSFKGCMRALYIFLSAAGLKFLCKFCCVWVHTLVICDESLYTKISPCPNTHW